MRDISKPLCIWELCTGFSRTIEPTGWTDLYSYTISGEFCIVTQYQEGFVQLHNIWTDLDSYTIFERFCTVTQCLEGSVDLWDTGRSVGNPHGYNHLTTKWDINEKVNYS